MRYTLGLKLDVGELGGAGEELGVDVVLAASASDQVTVLRAAEFEFGVQTDGDAPGSQSRG